MSPGSGKLTTKVIAIVVIAAMLKAPSLPLSEISAPPPISKVLHDLYQDETRAN